MLDLSGSIDTPSLNFELISDSLACGMQDRFC